MSSAPLSRSLPARGSVRAPCSLQRLSRALPAKLPVPVTSAPVFPSEDARNARCRCYQSARRSPSAQAKGALTSRCATQCAWGPAFPPCPQDPRLAAPTSSESNAVRRGGEGPGATARRGRSGSPVPTSRRAARGARVGMAIYHLTVKPVSRGAGRSATAAAAVPRGRADPRPHHRPGVRLHAQVRRRACRDRAAAGRRETRHQLGAGSAATVERSRGRREAHRRTRGARVRGRAAAGTDASAAAGTHADVQSGARKPLRLRGGLCPPYAAPDGR